MKILEAPSEVPDDAQITLKSKTSYLDQQQKGEELKGKKELEPASTLRKRERCDANFSEQEKVHVKYHRDKIGMYCLMQRKSHVSKNCIQGVTETLGTLLKRETSRKPHLMHCVNFFNCMELQR